MQDSICRRWHGGVGVLLGLAAASLAVPGCGDDKSVGNLFGESADDGADGGGADAADGGADGDAGDGADGDADGGRDDDDGDGGPRFDVASGESAGADGGACDPAVDPTCSGCNAVDVLFVIDNSGTMCSKQDALAAAFPGFVDAMWDELPPGTDLHVAVTTSGFSTGGSHGETNCAPNEPQATIEQYYTRPTEGTVAGNGLQGRLFEQGGQRYFAADTGNPGEKQGLKDWFTGAATGVGCGVSSFEYNASGAAWALHPANDATNAGFLRDEGAALLIFILTDEGDQSLDVETVPWLHDTVVAAKPICGEDCILVGGLLPTYCPGTYPGGGSQEFLESFSNPPVIDSIGGFIGPAPDYASVVGSALAGVVAQKCEEIPPPAG